MVKHVMLIALFFLSKNNFAQAVYRIQGDGCYFTISLSDQKKSPQNSKTNTFEVLLEIINHDSVDKFFPIINDGGKKILLNFSEFSRKSYLLNFFIGTCNEEMFPLHCSYDSFLLRRISPKEKTTSKYVFKSSHSISYYLSQTRIDFTFRFLNPGTIEIANREKAQILYSTYINKSKKLMFSFNSENYNQNLRREEEREQK
jgi:hypothetical protein